MGLEVLGVVPGRDGEWILEKPQTLLQILVNLALLSYCSIVFEVLIIIPM